MQILHRPSQRTICLLSMGLLVFNLLAGNLSLAANASQNGTLEDDVELLDLIKDKLSNASLSDLQDDLTRLQERNDDLLSEMSNISENIPEQEDETDLESGPTKTDNKSAKIALVRMAGIIYTGARISRDGIRNEMAILVVGIAVVIMSTILLARTSYVQSAMKARKQRYLEKKRALGKTKPVEPRQELTPEETKEEETPTHDPEETSEVKQQVKREDKSTRKAKKKGSLAPEDEQYVEYLIKLGYHEEAEKAEEETQDE